MTTPGGPHEPASLFEPTREYGTPAPDPAHPGFADARPDPVDTQAPGPTYARTPAGAERRGFPWSTLVRRLSIPLGALIMVWLGLATFYLWSARQYTVHERDDAVAVERGVGWFATHHTTDVDLALLPSDARAQLRAGIELNDADAVEQTVNRLRTQADECRGTLEAPCPPRAVVPPALVVQVETYPHGDRLVMTWDSIDERTGTATTLAVNGAAPPQPCPRTVEAAGSCTFTGDFDRTYTASLVTSGAQGAVDRSVQVRTTTGPAPRARVTKGGRHPGTDASTGFEGEFCDVRLTVVGLAPHTTYRTTLRMSAHAAKHGRVTTDDEGSVARVIGAYADPAPDSWVRVEVGPLRTPRLTWECGG